MEHHTDLPAILLGSSATLFVVTAIIFLLTRRCGSLVLATGVSALIYLCAFGLSFPLAERQRAIQDARVSPDECIELEGRVELHTSFWGSKRYCRLDNGSLERMTAALH